jgi:hypothetical protein
MKTISVVMFLAVAVVALGAVGVTTTLMSTHVAEAKGSGGECHINKGSFGCTGPGAQEIIGPTFICNKNDCHGTGPK